MVDSAQASIQRPTSSAYRYPSIPLSVVTRGRALIRDRQPRSGSPPAKRFRMPFRKPTLDVSESMTAAMNLGDFDLAYDFDLSIVRKAFMAAIKGFQDKIESWDVHPNDIFADLNYPSPSPDDASSDDASSDASSVNSEDPVDAGYNLRNRANIRQPARYVPAPDQMQPVPHPPTRRVNPPAPAPGPPSDSSSNRSESGRDDPPQARNRRVLRRPPGPARDPHPREQRQRGPRTFDAAGKITSLTSQTFRALFGTELDERFRHSIGDRVRCTECNAEMYPIETNKRGKFSLCCGKGKFQTLPLYPEPPRLIRDLMSGQHLQSARFLKDIRKYNLSLCVAYTCGLGHHSGYQVGFANMPAWAGRMYFTLHNPLNEIPPNAQQLHGIQLYIADDNLARSVLLSKPNGLSVDLIMDLRDLIKQCNPILHSLIPAIDRFPLIIVHRFLKGTSYTNQPPAGADQIALVRMVGPDNAERQTLIATPGNKTVPVRSNCSSLPPLRFPLLFAHGSDGLH